MSDVRTLDYTELTDQEAFDVWLTECPVEYVWQDDIDSDEGEMYYLYSFKVGGDDAR